MKVEERIIEREGNVAGEVVNMSIDPDAFAHIMSVLTDLYSDPELAVLREYSTNAWDSHVEAGVTRPIEVTLPSPLTPFLSIRDYGVGLDAEGIRSIYSQYGASTKRGSNDVVGMLGLGCKSALTYTDQFTVIGRKDGQEIQVAIGRDEDGAGSMTIVSHTDTDEPNGVEVIIPARRQHNFNDLARSFFRFWQPERVLVNGAHPEPVKGLQLSDRLIVLEGEETNYVVMGGVPYPVASAGGVGRFVQRDAKRGEGELSRLPGNRTVAAFVDIGEVNFTPSREALQLTRTTKDTLTRISDELTTTFHDKLAQSVADSKTTQDAVDNAAEAIYLGLPQERCIWQGRQVVLTVERERTSQGADYPFLMGTNAPSGYNSYRKQGDWTQHFPIRDRQGDRPLIVFTDWEGAAITETKRAKVEQYLTKKGHDLQTRMRWAFCRVPLTPDELHWCPTVYAWPDVDAEKLPSTGTAAGGGKLKGTYWWTDPTRSYHKHQIAASDIDPTKTVWYRGNYYTASYSPAVETGLIPSDFKVICLEANRVDKFKRDFPSVPEAGEYVRAKVLAMFDKISGEDLAAARYQVEGDARVKSLSPDPNDILDPVVRKAHELASRSAPGVAQARDIIRKYQRWLPADKLAARMPKVELTPLEKYPLLGNARYAPSLTGKFAQHSLLYINAAFAAEGK